MLGASDGRMYCRRWTEAEVDALMQAYDLLTPAYNQSRYIADLWGHWWEIWTGPDRSLEAIQRKAKRLGLEPKIEPRSSACLRCGKPRGVRTKTGVCSKCRPAWRGRR